MSQSASHISLAELDQAPAYNYCALPLMSYACRPDQSQGRLMEEPESRYRNPFQRDRDRIIHTAAFRRLKYKTQVFVYHEGDHYRTRLTHTIEVAQIARSLARALMVNEDLAEAIALAHDLGHTPFAHMGEEALQKCMEGLGGFDHNDQSLRVLTTLEKKYPQWQGLNLTWETLEGVAKHNGPRLKKNQKPDLSLLPISVYELSQKVDLKLDQYASLEAQIAAISDDIAYNNHDVEDGLSAGFFTLDQLEDLSLIAPILQTIRSDYPSLDDELLLSELIRRMIGMMVEDVMAETEKNLKDSGPQSPDDIRRQKKQIVSFSKEMNNKVNELRGFLFQKLYKHYSLQRILNKVETIIPDLFHKFMNKYTLMPNEWQRQVEELGGQKSDTARARIVCDYIAGMTDRYAIREHERLFDLYWDMR
jgi:dGTPase